MTMILSSEGNTSAFRPLLGTLQSSAPIQTAPIPIASSHFASPPAEDFLDLHVADHLAVPSLALPELSLLQDMTMQGDSLFAHSKSLAYISEPLKVLNCLDISQAWTRDAVEHRIQILAGQNLNQEDLSLSLDQPEATAAQRALRPPSKDSEPNAENIRQLREWLDLRLADGPLATSTYSFYEDIDAYLGPWGDEGYPVQYGKKYNHAFMLNERLGTNSQTRQWMRNAGLNLQKELAKFIVQRYQAGTLATVSEEELRNFAFDSHPRSYIQGGLPNLVLSAPELLPFIMAVPKAEFSPQARDFDASLKQVAVSAMGTVPRALGLAAFCLDLDIQYVERLLQTQGKLTP